MDSYNYNNLKSLIGQVINVIDNANHQATLVITDVIRSQINGDEWDAFSVIYQGSSDFHIPQGTYTLVHPEFGEKQLFLTPNSENEYETVITRKKQAVV
ncbi:DUF6916 family protein [Aliikangiella maris]|uniref:DUF6916 domain-containing protein n=2 Tax=Aliikangiella maris TaxID=3162458 RepID=A0ABV3MN91_9GAMM